MNKTDISPKCNTVHASGHLTPAAPGILEGVVSFPVRGRMKFRVERRASDELTERARIYSLTPQPSFAYLTMHDGDRSFRGVLKVEGYAFGVQVVQQDDGAWGVSFLDRGRG